MYDRVDTNWKDSSGVIEDRGAAMDAGKSGGTADSDAYERSMPGILMVLIGLLVFFMLTDLGVYLLTLGKSYMAVVSALVKLALIVGILKGSDGTRVIMLMAGFVTIVSGCSQLIWPVLSGKVLDTTTFGLGLLATLFGVFVVWCATRDEVKRYIFSRSKVGRLMQEG